MEEELLQEIEILKNKIKVEIEQLRLYNETEYICDFLLGEMENFKHSIDNEQSLIKYKAYLGAFLDVKIGYINNLVAQTTNESIFDDRESEDINIKKIEKEIEELIECTRGNSPTLASGLLIEYNNLKKAHEDNLKLAKKASKYLFESNVGINHKKLPEGVIIHDPDGNIVRHDYGKPVLSLYSSTTAANKAYLRALEVFKMDLTRDFKTYIETVKKVNQVLESAYKEISDPATIEKIKEIEKNYKTGIEKCIKSGASVTGISIKRIQDSMIEATEKINKMVEEEKERKRLELEEQERIQRLKELEESIRKIEEENKRQIKKTLQTMKFNSPSGESFELSFDLPRISRWIFNYPDLKDEYYSVLYFLVERAKFIKYKIGEVPKDQMIELTGEEEVVLQQMFLERLKTINSGNIEETIIRLKRDGYYNVLDEKYKEFFEQIEDTRGIYHTEFIEQKPLENLLDWDNVRIHGNTIKHRGGTNEMAISKFGKEATVVIRKVGDLFTIRFKYPKRNQSNAEYINEPYVVYHTDREGCFINIVKKNIEIEHYVLGYYLARDARISRYCGTTYPGYTPSDSEYSILNSKFEEIGRIDAKRFLVDRTRRNVLVKTSKGNYVLYDDKFNPIKEFELDDTTIDQNVGILNDGVVAFLNTGYDKIYYYDLDEMKVIMTTRRAERSLYGYGEGLLNVYDKPGYKENLETYVNKKGERATKIGFTHTSPFFRGCAYVGRAHNEYNNGGGDGFIDRTFKFSSVYNLNEFYHDEECYLNIEDGIYEQMVKKDDHLPMWKDKIRRISCEKYEADFKTYQPIGFYINTIHEAIRRIPGLSTFISPEKEREEETGEYFKKSEEGSSTKKHKKKTSA